MLVFKNLLFTVIVPGTVGVYLPQWLAGSRSLAGGAVGAAGWGLLALGACIYAWCLWDFGSFGRGTPAPIDAPKRLVVRGLYRYTRNPMYVGVLGVILAQVLLLREPLLLVYAALVATAFHLFIVLYEEPHLTETFGASYADYCGQVNRWLPRPRSDG